MKKIKNIFNNFKKNGASSPKIKKGRTDKFTNLALTVLGFELVILLIATLIAAPLLVADTFNSAVVTFNIFALIALFGLPVVLTYLNFDFVVSIKQKGFADYRKEDHNKITVNLIVISAVIAFAIGSVVGTLNFQNRTYSFGSQETAVVVFLVMAAIAHFVVTYFVVWFTRNSKNVKKAFYAGSFDPIHDGHINVVEKAIKTFDKVTVVVADNELKQSNPMDERVALAKQKLSHLKNVKVISLKKGLLADLAKEKEVRFLIRSARNNFDFDYEVKMAENNKIRNDELETVLIMADSKFREISSTQIREESNPFAKEEKHSQAELNSEPQTAKELEDSWFNIK